MATKFISPSWRMPKNSNQSKASNYSLDFNGTDEYIDCGTISAIPSATELSVSFWANTDSTSENQVVFGDNSSTPIFSFEYWGSANRMYFEYGTSLYAYLTLTSVVTVGSWHNVILVYNGGGSSNTDKIKIYIDGVDKSSLMNYVGTIPASLNASIGDFWVGNGQKYNVPFNGKMGPVSIFDYALTGSAVTALYNSGIPSNPLAVTTPPVAYYDLGQGSAYASGSAGIIEPNLAAATGSTVFDFASGDSDFINAGSTSYLNDVTEMSISTWFNLTTAAINKGLMDDEDTHFAIYSKSVSGDNYSFRINISGSGNRVNISGTPFTAGQWHNLVMTYNAGTLTFYADGDVVGSSVYSGTIPTDLGSNAGDLRIGTYGTLYWDGLISNAQIWTKELSSAEALTLYNNGTPLQSNIPQSGSLKAWYKLGLDTSNWDGSDWVISRSPFNYSKCLNFPNAANLIKYDSFNMNGKSEITFSFWYNHNVTVNSNDKILGTFDTVYWAFAANQNRSGISGKPVSLSIKTGNASSNTTAAVSISNITDADSGWNLLTATYDGSNLRGYLNGEQVGSDQPITGNLMDSTGHGSRVIDVVIRDGGGSVMENMKISNFVIWDKGLTSPEVATLLNGGTPFSQKSDFPQQANMLLWNTLTDMDTSSGGGVFDNSGNGVVIANPSSPPVSFNFPVSTNAGFSSGMDTTNLVPSNLIKSIPYSGYSMYFDGSNEYIDCTDNDAFTFGNGSSDSAFSVSTWINMGTVNDFVPIAKDSSGAREWAMRMVSGRVHFYTIDNSAGSYIGISGSFTPAADEWWNFIVTYDATEASSGFKLYYNGIQDTTGNYESGTYTAMENTSAILSIGMQQNGTVALPGNISNTAIFNKVLTEDEAIRIYNGGSPGNLSSLGPNSWWSLGADSYFNGSEWICPDLGSNAINGTSVNMESGDLKGFGPDSLANGTSTNLDLGSDLIGEAPGSTGNAISINMNSLARTGSTP